MYQNFTEIAKDGYRLWMAQYADFSDIYGFIDKPWHKGSVAPFNGWQMQQYTSSGILNGWSGHLDLDKFYGTESDWQSLCESNSVSPAPQDLKPADRVVVAEVLANRYGTGEERNARLKADGYDPESVQKKINELYAIAAKIKPMLKGGYMAYFNSIVKIVRSI